MPIDASIAVATADGWVEATNAAVASLDIFSVNGEAPLLCRWQDTQPITDGQFDGVLWGPGHPAKDFGMPGGLPTRMWVRAHQGDTVCYIKHA